MPLEVGDVIDGKYQIVGLLGAGGMGEVFDGLHRKIRRRVAIKVLRASFSKDTAMVRRFEREAEAAGRIGSPHIVDVYDVGELRTGERFIIQEFLDGESLGSRLRRERTLSPESVVGLLRQLLEGLAAAHAAGFVHRDLKPDNVFVIKDKDGKPFVKILDFGIAKLHAVGESVTQTGMVLGTPQYMAPEQLKGSRFVDQRSDVFAVGALMFRMLTGRTPYRGENLHELLARLVTEDAPPLKSVLPTVDDALAAIVDRALQRKKEKRFGSALEFGAALGEWRPAARVVLRTAARGTLVQDAPRTTVRLADQSAAPSSEITQPRAAKTSTDPLGKVAPIPDDVRAAREAVRSPASSNPAPPEAPRPSVAPLSPSAPSRTPASWLTTRPPAPAQQPPARAPLASRPAMPSYLTASAQSLPAAPSADPLFQSGYGANAAVSQSDLDSPTLVTPSPSLLTLAFKQSSGRRNVMLGVAGACLLTLVVVGLLVAVSGGDNTVVTPEPAASAVATSPAIGEPAEPDEPATAAADPSASPSSNATADPQPSATADPQPSATADPPPPPTPKSKPPPPRSPWPRPPPRRKIRTDI